MGFFIPIGGTNHLYQYELVPECEWRQGLIGIAAEGLRKSADCSLFNTILVVDLMLAHSSITPFN